MCIVSWLIIMSFAEYAIHRWLMHRKRWLLGDVFRRHVTLHHSKYFKIFDKEDDAVGRTTNIRLEAWFSLLVGTPIWLTLAYLELWDWLVVGMVVVTLHAWLWSLIHNEMHNPTNVWWSYSPIYRYLREYHRRHHESPHYNFNVVLPLFDFIFFTRR